MISKKVSNMTIPNFLATVLATACLAIPAVYADDIDEAPPETGDPTDVIDETPEDAVVGESDDSMDEPDADFDDESPELEDEPAEESDPAMADEVQADEISEDDSAEESSTTEPAPAEEPVVVEDVDPAIQQLQDYYAKVYGEPLKQRSRLAKLVAVMSLSKIDAPQLTDILMTAATERDQNLSQLAWEAVFARSESLTPAQRLQWTQAGLKAADSGAFPGTTVAPVIEAAAQYPLSQRDLIVVKKLIERLCQESDPNTPEGAAALEAGARALAAWSDPRLVRQLYPATIGKSKLFDRAVILFSKLPGAPKDGGPREWREWNSKTRITPTPKDQLKPFVGSSIFFPKPEKIVDPNDPKWVRDAELPELTVASLRTVFCLDATGSGARLNEFVTGFIATLAGCIDVAADKNQMGVVYYRHEIDPKVMADCCRNPGNRPDDFLVHPLPVTPNIAQLVHEMKEMHLPVHKGHDGGGAAYVGALQSAQKMLGPKGRDSISVVALFGDAKGTVGKEEFIPKAAQQLVDSGIQVFFLPRDNRAERALSEAITVSQNDPIFYLRDIEFLQDNEEQDAIDIFENSAFGHLATRILSSALPKEYSDRAAKIVICTTKILRAKEHARQARAQLDAIE